MNNYFVILAAGKSKRFHKNITKQFVYFKNKEIIDHSVEKSLNSKLFRRILIVTNNLKHLIKNKMSIKDEKISINQSLNRVSSSDIISYDSACNASPTSIALASPNLICDES